MPSREDVLRARARLRGWVHQTPVLASKTINRMLGVEVFFKAENLQKSGSFKARGASFAVLGLDGVREVATHSSGNHGAALAYAAEKQGIAATIVVPSNSNPNKVAAIARYGARILSCGPTLAEREEVLAEHCAQSGAEVVPPYDDPRVIVGQGTAALELMEQVPGLSEIWLPVGGGGLASGSVLATQSISVQVMGAEPKLADDAARSLTLGERQPQLPPITIADGLRTALGELNFAILHRAELPIEVVEEDAILAAQIELMSCLKVLVEPSSAVPYAGLKAHLAARAPAKRKIGLILTGGNVDLSRFAQLG